MTYYTSEPDKFYPLGNGAWRYRYNIEAVEASDGDAPAQWRSDEVEVWQPLTSDKILEAVIAATCPASREQKLVNEYNAANLGLVGGGKTSDEAKERIAAYRDFLTLRANLKAAVEADCSAAGII